MKYLPLSQLRYTATLPSLQQIQDHVTGPVVPIRTGRDGVSVINDHLSCSIHQIRGHLQVPVYSSDEAKDALDEAVKQFQKQGCVIRESTYWYTVLAKPNFEATGPVALKEHISFHNLGWGVVVFNDAFAEEQDLPTMLKQRRARVEATRNKDVPGLHEWARGNVDSYDHMETVDLKNEYLKRTPITKIYARLIPSMRERGNEVVHQCDDYVLMYGGYEVGGIVDDLRQDRHGSYVLISKSISPVTFKDVQPVIAAHEAMDLGSRFPDTFKDIGMTVTHNGKDFVILQGTPVGGYRLPPHLIALPGHNHEMLVLLRNNNYGVTDNTTCGDGYQLINCLKNPPQYKIGEKVKQKGTKVRGLVNQITRTDGVNRYWLTYDGGSVGPFAESELKDDSYYDQEARAKPMLNFQIQAQGVTAALDSLNVAMGNASGRLLKAINPAQYKRYQVEQLANDVHRAVFYPQAEGRSSRRGIKPLAKVTRIQDEVVINLDPAELADFKLRAAKFNAQGAMSGRMSGLGTLVHEQIEAAVMAAAPLKPRNVCLSSGCKIWELTHPAFELMGYNSIHSIYRVVEEGYRFSASHFDVLQTNNYLYLRAGQPNRKMPTCDSEIMKIYYHLGKGTAEEVTEAIVGQGGKVLSHYGNYHFYETPKDCKFYLKKDCGLKAFSGKKYTILFPEGTAPTDFFAARAAGEQFDKYASHKPEYKIHNGYIYDDAIVEARMACKNAAFMRHYGGSPMTINAKLDLSGMELAVANHLFPQIVTF